MGKWQADIEEAPRLERIQTSENGRRQGRKKKFSSARGGTGRCYKAAYTRKQALSQCNMLLAKGEALYLRVYKCVRCRHWHLTHQEPRKKNVL